MTEGAYEYKILRDPMTYPGEMEAAINELAGEGWRVVGYGLAPSDLRGHFQREAVLERRGQVQ